MSGCDSPSPVIPFFTSEALLASCCAIRSEVVDRRQYKKYARGDIPQCRRSAQVASLEGKGVPNCRLASTALLPAAQGIR
jgi:hypothetical protein